MGQDFVKFNRLDLKIFSIILIWNLWFSFDIIFIEMDSRIEISCRFEFCEKWKNLNYRAELSNRLMLKDVENCIEEKKSSKNFYFKIL